MFLGGLGTDASGAMLQSLVEKDGVRTVFARQPGLATGHCIALVRGHERTLCASVVAGIKYEAAGVAPGGNAGEAWNGYDGDPFVVLPKWLPNTPQRAK